MKASEFMDECITLPIVTHKRKMEDDYVDTRDGCFRKTSEDQECIHRMRIENQQMLLVLENYRKEKVDIINEAGSEISKMRREKEDVIKQSVTEITRLRGEVARYKQMLEGVTLHMKKQSDVVEYLRRALAVSESFNTSKDSFNHIGAF